MNRRNFILAGSPIGLLALTGCLSRGEEAPPDFKRPDDVRDTSNDTPDEEDDTMLADTDDGHDVAPEPEAEDDEPDHQDEVDQASELACDDQQDDDRDESRVDDNKKGAAGEEHQRVDMVHASVGEVSDGWARVEWDTEGDGDPDDYEVRLDFQASGDVFGDDMGSHSDGDIVPGGDHEYLFEGPWDECWEIVVDLTWKVPDKADPEAEYDYDFIVQWWPPDEDVECEENTKAVIG